MRFTLSALALILTVALSSGACGFDTLKDLFTSPTEPIRCSLAYDSLPGRTFVNHGNAVYAGDGVTLTPEGEVNCSALAAILNAVAGALAPAGAAG